MRLQLDLEVLAPVADEALLSELWRREKMIDVGLSLGAMFADEDNPGNVGARYTVIIHNEAIEKPWSGSFNYLSNKDRKKLKKMIKEIDISPYLKAIWTSLNRKVKIRALWTVLPDDRDGDHVTNYGDDDYNNLMLSPLEQLAAIL